MTAHTHVYNLLVSQRQKKPKNMTQHKIISKTLPTLPKNTDICSDLCQMVRYYQSTKERAIEKNVFIVILCELQKNYCIHYYLCQRNPSHLVGNNMVMERQLSKELKNLHSGSFLLVSSQRLWIMLLPPLAWSFHDLKFS